VKIIIAFFLFFCLFTARAGAEKITLKSGKVLEAPIIEENQEFIKIDYNGTPLYYDRKYILSIEGEAVYNSADAYLGKALEAGSAGKYDEAETLLKKADKLYPGDQNIGGALDIIDGLKANKINNEYAQSLFKGSYYMMSEDYSQAIPFLEKAAEVDPQQQEVYYNLGSAYYSMGNYNKAIEYLNRVIELKPEDADSLRLLGSAYWMLQYPDKAKEKFIVAMVLYRKRGDLENAESISRLIGKLEAGAP
jgi:tetratricopeptide (TPR) repeat protein